MLEKLRAKPYHTRRKIAFGLTIAIFSIILFVWISSWDARSSGNEIREKTVSPLSGFSTMFEGFMSGTRDSVSPVPSYVQNTPSVVTSTGTSPLSFDASGVVVIDPSMSTTTATSSPVR